MADKILVVDDEPSIVETIVYTLQTDGFDPVACGTGAEALAHMDGDGGGFALVVLDVGLPDMSGFEICKAIRKTKTTPIIFLTAREGEIDRVVGLEIGGDDYVVKPFSPRELSARVRAVLRRTGAGRSPNREATPEDGAGAHRRAGEFEIDDERMRISYGREALELSRYEFRVLRILVNHPGRVFTRDQLMEMAWEEPETAMERTVDTHIKSLRAKLRAVNSEVDPIVTHRGIGYSLREEL